jgi:hypothetical protein
LTPYTLTKDLIPNLKYLVIPSTTTEVLYCVVLYALGRHGVAESSYFHDSPKEAKPPTMTLMVFDKKAKSDKIRS